MIKCLVINPEDRSIGEVERSQITHKEICELLNQNDMDILGALPGGDLVWVDGSGFLRKGPQHTFVMKAIRSLPVFGRAVITGPEIRERLTSTRVLAHEVKVDWSGLMICTGFDTVTKESYVPGIGMIPTISSTPRLEKVG